MQDTSLYLEENVYWWVYSSRAEISILVHVNFIVSKFQNKASNRFLFNIIVGLERNPDYIYI